MYERNAQAQDKTNIQTRGLHHSIAPNALFGCVVDVQNDYPAIRVSMGYVCPLVHKRCVIFHSTNHDVSGERHRDKMAESGIGSQQTIKCGSVV